MRTIFYDIETTGLDPEFDQIIQFAAIVTDHNLRTISEHEFRVRLRPDVIPNPEALLVTGYDPGSLTMEGLSEYEAVKRIFQLVNETPSCLIGFNSGSFDDMFLRWSFYRNLLDPYSFTWKDEAFTADMFSYVVFCAALRPESLSWEHREDGSLNLRLESLMRANDLVGEGKAHDALTDTRATLALARKLQGQSSERFNAFIHRFQGYTEKNDIEPKAKNQPVLLIGKQFGREANYQAVARMVTSEKKSCCFIDLSRISFGKISEPNEFPLIFKKWGDSTISSSQVGKSTLPEDVLQLAKENDKLLAQNPDLMTAIKRRIQTGFQHRENIDADCRLYGGFPPFSDPLYLKFHQSDEKDHLIEQMAEPYKTLAQRIQWRNFDRTIANGRIDQTQTSTKGKTRFTRQEAIEKLNELSGQGKYELEKLENLKKWYEAR